MEENKTELKLIHMSEIESEEVSWLWYPFIPYGKLTIVQGIMPENLIICFNKLLSLLQSWGRYRKAF